MGDDEKALPPVSGGSAINFRYVAYGVGAFLVVFGLITVLIFFHVVLPRIPSKPSFTLQDITVSSFNVSTSQPYRLSTNMQVTVSSRNTMSRTIIYTEMDLYTEYRNEQITLRYSLPLTHQEHKEVVVWSPYLAGHVETISPISGPVLMQDLNYGAVLVLIKIEGRLKIKVAGMWAKYKLYGHCPAMIQLGNMNTHDEFAVSAKEFKFSLVQNCYVEISM